MQKQTSKQAKTTNDKHKQQAGKGQSPKQASSKYSKLPSTARGGALTVLGQVLEEGAYTN